MMKRRKGSFLSIRVMGNPNIPNAWSTFAESPYRRTLNQMFIDNIFFMGE